MANVAVIEAALRLDGKQWERTIKKAKASFQTLITDTRAQAAAAGAILLGAGVGLAKVATELKNAGDQAVRLKKNLDTTFDGDQLDRITEKIRILGATPPFSEEQFTGAAKQLQTFGRDVEDNLERIGNIAAFTGQNFDTISKAFAGLGVDDRAAKQLEKLANISPERLKEYGAVLDETGTKLDLTGDNAEKAKRALEELADKEFADAMNQAVTATDQLSGALTLLKQDAGLALAEFADSAAGFIVPLVEGFRALPGPVKASAGLMVAFGAAAATATAATIALGLAWGPLTAGFATGAAILKTQLVTGLLAAQLQLGGLQLAANAANVSLATLAATIGVVAVAAVGLHLYTKEVEANTAAQEKLLKIELQRASNQKTLGGLIGKSAQQLKDEGKTSKDLANGILALQERIEVAREAGNTALVDRLKAQVADLRDAKTELAKAEAEQRSRAAAEEAANTPEAKKAREEEAKAAEALRKEQLDAELDGIALRLAKDEISQKQSLKLRAEALAKYKASENEKRALAIETAKFETDQATKAVEDAEARKEAARSGRVDKRLAEIELLRTQEKLSAQEEIDSLKRILDTYKLTEDEKQSLKLKTAQLEAKLRQDNEKAAEDAKKAQERKDQDAVKQAEKNAADLAAARAEGNALKQEDISRQIDELQNKAETSGENNTAKVRALIEEQLKLQLEAIALEAEKEKAATDSAEARAQIEANANEKMKAAIRDRAQQEKDAVQEQIDAINALNEAKKPKKEASLGGVFDISQLGESISGSLGATNALSSAQVATPQGLSQLQLLADQLRNAEPDQVRTLAGTVAPSIKSDVALDVNVNVKADGTSTAEARVTSVNGQGTNITQAARGVPRGRTTA